MNDGSFLFILVDMFIKYDWQAFLFEQRRFFDKIIKAHETLAFPNIGELLYLLKSQSGFYVFSLQKFMFCADYREFNGISTLPFWNFSILMLQSVLRTCLIRGEIFFSLVKINRENWKLLSPVLVLFVKNYK